jgi:hypothetical protein
MERIRVVLGDIVDTKSYAPIVVRFKWRNYDQEADDDHHEWIYCTDDEANWMHFVEDFKIKIKYMLLIGPRAEEFEQLLRATVSNWPRDQILERAHKPKSRADRCKILYVLAIDTIERGFDQETFGIYSNALADSDSLIRKAAVLGASYLRWPQLAEPLRLLATNVEKDEAIREEAAVLLKKLGQDAS